MSMTSDDDEIGAHLERGWDLLQQGDAEGARAAAEEVKKLDADVPDTYTLLGAIAAAGGDDEAAFEHYDKAMELDPELVEPMLYAAELHLAAGETEDAIALCEQALDAAEEEDEFLDALLLKAEAHAEAGDERGVRQTLGELPPTDYPDAQFHMRAARLFLDLGDLDTAEKEIERAIALAPGFTEAVHVLALIHEERGDTDRMIETFLKVREADLREPAPPWGVERAVFEERAEAALAELPPEIRERLANVPILAEDYPSVELVREGADPRMMGFFAGTPLPEQSATGAPPHLEHVLLYQRNIERYCRSPGEVEDEIRKTLLHETGHFFGLSEEELEALGLD